MSLGKVRVQVPRLSVCERPLRGLARGRGRGCGSAPETQGRGWKGPSSSELESFCARITRDASEAFTPILRFEAPGLEVNQTCYL